MTAAIVFTRYTREQIREARDWYLAQNDKERRINRRENQRRVILAFDFYPCGMDLTDTNVKEKFKRVETMIERYFKLKELNRL